MIHIKDQLALDTMAQAGKLLAGIFSTLSELCVEGISTLDIDAYIAQKLHERSLISMTKGYRGYQHVSCISVNSELVHGVPAAHKRLAKGDLVKIDVCASYHGYCADMARPFFIGTIPDTDKKKLFVRVGRRALDKGISMAHIGNRLTDISAAIQREIEQDGYAVVRDFAGHGIGKHMHEDPEILNYGKPGLGPRLKEGMVFALEPMFTMGSEEVYITDDGWTAKTADESLAMHIEDTVAITQQGPHVLTRCSSDQNFDNGGDIV